MVEKPVSVADELKKEKESPCPFGKMLREMPDNLSVEFREVLAGPEFYTAQIVRALERRGYHVSRHRLQECRYHCNCGELNEH